jgi:4-carboxymuconolactone decarboxylase
LSLAPGQILFVIDGLGYIQEKGKPIRVIQKGDVITCPPNVEHWHGASPGSTEGKTASPVGDADKYQTGKKTLQTLTGKEEKMLVGANAFSPAIDTFLKEHLFADIFSRDILNYQQRELVTVSALASMSGVAPQLQAHIGMAINTGITSSQLSEAFEIIDQAVGKKQGDIARATLENVLAVKKQ